MSIKDSILISLSLVLVVTAIYLKLDVYKLKKENLQIKDEFVRYKKEIIKTQLAKEKLLLAQQEKQKLQEKQRFLQEQKDAVKIRVNQAYTLAQMLHKKYKHSKNIKAIIIEALTQKNVYIKNYQGNRLNNVSLIYLQNLNRTIPLEEIQKVRRHKEGYINIATKNEKQIIYVKDLKMFKLFIGASVILR